MHLVREQDSTRWRLSVSGLGAEAAVREFDNLAACMKWQAEVEQRLLAEGYQIAQMRSDLGSEDRAWQGSDQHRTEPMSETLFWSKRGDVACAVHAPEAESERWRAEGWCRIPTSAIRRRGLEYQCPRCAPDGRPHRHIQAVDRNRDDIAPSI